jgi:5-methylcytosine-specific restriction endonuclease McrA
MNRKIYKTEKIKSGRPRCPHRVEAVKNGAPRYVDKDGIERLTASGNRVAGRREWQLTKARSEGVSPRKSQAPEYVRSQKNVANVKRWRKENPDKARAMRSRENFIRRSSVRERTIEPVTAQFLIEQRKLQDDRCAYCFSELHGAGHQDHIVPIAKGGAHAPSNIVWTCEPCNLRKSSKLGWVFIWENRMRK